MGKRHNRRRVHSDRGDRHGEMLRKRGLTCHPSSSPQASRGRLRASAVTPVGGDPRVSPQRCRGEKSDHAPSTWPKPPTPQPLPSPEPPCGPKGNPNCPPSCPDTPTVHSRLSSQRGPFQTLKLPCPPPTPRSTRAPPPAPHVHPSLLGGQLLRGRGWCQFCPVLSTEPE